MPEFSQTLQNTEGRYNKPDDVLNVTSHINNIYRDLPARIWSRAGSSSEVQQLLLKNDNKYVEWSNS